jgi:hypothetical protein
MKGKTRKFNIREEIILSPEQVKEIGLSIGKAAHEKALAQTSVIKREYKKQVSTAIMTALGLVIALVWKDVVTAIIPSMAPPSLLEKFPFLASIYTAAIVTALAVIGIVLVSGWAKSEEEKEKK